MRLFCCAALVALSCQRQVSNDAPDAAPPPPSASVSGVGPPLASQAKPKKYWVRPPRPAEKPWSVPKLPKLPLRFHQVASSEDPFLQIERLENGAVVRRDPTFGTSPDVLVVHNGRAELLESPYPDLQGATPERFAGAFPELLVLVTQAKQEIKPVVSRGTSTVQWRRDGAWTPLPGGLASHHHLFHLIPPRLGKRQVLVRGKAGYEILEFPSGAPSGLHVASTIENAPFHVDGVAVLRSTLLIVGRVLFSTVDDGFSGRKSGPTVVQRFEGEAKEPIVDFMPEPARYAWGSDGLAASGDRVFIALRDYGFGRYLCIFDGTAWQLERLPLEEDARELSAFSAAPDGSLFFAPVIHEGWDAARRDATGRYTAFDFPRKTQVCDLYAESATSVWIACDYEDQDGSTLFHTRPVGAPRLLRGPERADAGGGP